MAFFRVILGSGYSFSIPLEVDQLVGRRPPAVALLKGTRGAYTHPSILTWKGRRAPSKAVILHIGACQNLGVNLGDAMTGMSSGCPFQVHAFGPPKKNEAPSEELGASSLPACYRATPRQSPPDMDSSPT